MKSQNWLYSSPYKELFHAWKKETASPVIQPLEYDFFTKMNELLKLIGTSNKDKSSIEEKIDERVLYLFSSLKKSRWEKMIESFSRNTTIDTSFLTRQELNLWKSLERLFKWYNSLTMEENLFLEKESGSLNEKWDQENDKYKIEYLKVKFLKPLGKFIGTDLVQYGPFSINEEANLPADVVTKVLLPNNYIILIKDQK